MNRRRDTIPTELTSRPRWVLWKYGRPDKNGKPTKLPFKINGRCADVTDARDWSSFERTAAAYDRAKGFYSGIGFVMDGDGLCGVDFDDCVKDREIVISKVAHYVAVLDTYCEISPSGTGLRLFAFGKLPPRERKLRGFEFYDGVPHESGKAAGRFLTIIGNLLAGTPVTINARQAALEAVHAEVFAERIARKTRVRPPQITLIVSASDAELLDRARRARNGERFSRLYDLGQWQADFPSQSEADLWLLARLMFWTRGDEARADRLFRGSKLMREKWNCESYHERTMERARE